MKPVLYGLPFCGGCMALKSLLDGMGVEYEYRDASGTGAPDGVFSFPVLMAYGPDGEERGRLEGMVPASAVRAFMEEHR